MRKPWVTKYKSDIHLKLPKRQRRCFAGADVMPCEVSSTAPQEVQQDVPQKVPQSAPLEEVVRYNPVPQPVFEHQAPPRSIFDEAPDFCEIMPEHPSQDLPAQEHHVEAQPAQALFRPPLEEPARVIADLPDGLVVGEPAYVALQWRQPSFLFLALGWLISAFAGPFMVALLQGGTAALASPAGWIGVAVMGLPFLVFMGGVILLVNGRDVTMPVLIGTTYAVTHALTLLGVAALFPVLAANEGAIDAQIMAQAPQLGGLVASGPVMLASAVYIAAFLVFSIYALFAALLLRYVGMEIKS